MGLDIIIRSEVRLTEKDKYQMISLTCGIYLEKAIELKLFKTEVNLQR